MREKTKKTPFLVLIWGPGLSTDSPHLQKCSLKIREDLETVVGTGNVFFSEDIAAAQNEDPILKEIQESGSYAAEFVLFAAADAVVILSESVVSVAEAALFREELKGKSILFATKREGKSLASEVYRLLKVEEVSDWEWQKCHRIRRLAREFVEQLRVDKFRNKRNWTSAGSAMAKNKQRDFHVVPHGDHWIVRRGENHDIAPVHETQRSAVAAARKIARAYKGGVMIHGRDGHVRERDMYRSDSLPPKVPRTVRFPTTLSESREKIIRKAVQEVLRETRTGIEG